MKPPLNDCGNKKVIFVITTDGNENASQEYSAKMVKQMVARSQEKGWQFIFLGANIDAIEEAERIGIPRTHAATYRNDSKGVKLNYMAATKVVTCMRSDKLNAGEKALKIPEFLQPIKDHMSENE